MKRQSKSSREAPAATCRVLPEALLKAGILALSLTAFAVAGAGSPGVEEPTHLGVLTYGTGHWDAEILGNHRVVVRVDTAEDAVRVRIPWRRRDADPERKALIVTDDDDRPIDNVVRRSIDRESGEIAFEPTAGPGEYHVYYLPWVSEGRSNYPKVRYPEPRDAAEPAWRARHGLTAEDLAAGSWERLARATPLRIETIESFHSFFPMEVIASAQETAQVLADHPRAPYLLFPEDRRYPIRMARDLPLRWIQSGANRPVQGEAARGEWYAFQIGVWAARESIDDMVARFSSLRPDDDGSAIDATALRCVTLGGTDWKGQRFDKQVVVPKGRIQPLWCGVQVPQTAAPGTYRGQVTVAPEGMPATTLPIRLRVLDEEIAAHGDDEPWRHSRLRWLDSTLALDDEVTAPYEPVRVQERTVRILGRSFEVGPDGLIAAIDSYFPYEMTRIDTTPRAVLADPVSLTVQDAAGQDLAWSTRDFIIHSVAPGLATWETDNVAGPLRMNLSARAEFDGTIEFTARLSAAADTPIGDVRLQIPVARDVARYMMGMGRPGGVRPQQFDWHWDVERNQDGAWIGDVNAGLQFSLRDEHYVRPLNTNFYQLKPLVIPRSWDNDGRGGCKMREQGEAYLVSCSSGARTLRAGEPLQFDFKLLLTPFHPLDTDKHWRNRYYHRYRPLDEIQAAGANVINVHHATQINPFINYPFLRPGQMKAYVQQAHERGMKVKIYYTVRELSNRAPELFALLSLGDEVFADGAGGGYSWLQEHVDRGYIAGWFVPSLRDAALVNSGTSRWHNYYLEGLDWLARNFHLPRPLPYAQTL